MTALARRVLNRIRTWLDQLDDAHDCWEDHLGEGHGHHEPTGDSQ